MMRRPSRGAGVLFDGPMSIAPHDRSARTLSRSELVAVTTSAARDVRAGRYAVEADRDHRWHVRLRCDDDVDVWLISWTQDQGTQLHDHGGSSGAFTVVHGVLDEAMWASGGLYGEEHGAGATVTFGPHYVHDVRNSRWATAVSVHAYSPPLSRMRFYDVEDDRLVQLAEIWTDDPEEPLPEDVERRGA